MSRLDSNANKSGIIRLRDKTEPDLPRQNKSKKKLEPFYRKGDDLYQHKEKKPWKSAKRFIQLPRIIAADKRLSAEAVKLANIVAMFDMSRKIKGKEMGKEIKGGIVFPGLNILSAATGRSKPMIIKYIRELHAAGYIGIQKRYKKSNMYIMWLPIISSVEEIVRNYNVFSCPLSPEDFILSDKEAHLDQNVKDFFEILKEMKKIHWEILEDGKKEIPIAEIEEQALIEFRKAMLE
jgi:hypothetical protein